MGRIKRKRTDPVTDAWWDVGAWLASNEGRVFRGARRDIPDDGWIGLVVAEGVVAVAPGALEVELRRLGHYLDVQGWVARGYMAEEKGAALIPTKWSGITVKMYHLKIEGWKP